MATFKAVILKGKVHVKQDKTTNIKIRITHNKKSDYISTDLYVHHKKFSNGFATGGEAANFLNSRIRDELEKYTQRYWKLGDTVSHIPVKELKKRLMVADFKDEIDFHAFAEEYTRLLIAQGRIGSARGLNGVTSNLKKFKKKLLFSQINVQFLNEFVIFLKAKGVKNAVNNYMREFRVIFNAARTKYNDEDRGMIRIPNYPFKNFKFEKIKRRTADNCLSIEELHLLMDYTPPRERMQMAKDMFLLMFYLIGINSADLYRLGKPDKNNRVNFNRAKTGREYSIKLEPEAEEIISRYAGKESLINISGRYGYYLDWTRYMNVELKEIGKGINKKLQEQGSNERFPENVSTNWARHSWATIARNDCKINKDDVALCLGHEDSDNKVTDIYIKYDYSIIDGSNRMVIEKLVQKKNRITAKTVEINKEKRA